MNQAHSAPSWMRIEGRQLVTDQGPLQLRGIGLGNWMLIEHFMIGLPQVDYVMRQAFREVLGEKKAAAFWNAYMDNYFTDQDLQQIKAMGFNHVRIPFSYRHFESDSAPGQWLEAGFARLDYIIAICKRQGLWALLDLHSAPGCQASDWNAESAHGEAFLWDDHNAQKRVAALWGEIARRYQDEPTVMAYEILNEPVTSHDAQIPSLNAFHHRCIAAIRSVDQRHIIIVNGDKHATVLSHLDDKTFEDPQVMAAHHYYYHYTPSLKDLPSFPCQRNGETIDDDFLWEKGGLKERSNSSRIHRPAFLDEFGIGYRWGDVETKRNVTCGIIRSCEKHNVHWNLWHWKDVRGMGLMHMREGTPWLNLLQRIGAKELNEAASAATEAYMKQIEAFMRLDGKRRQRLAEETRRDLQMQMLWTLVERMKDLTESELAELGASFHSKNFEMDEPMGRKLCEIMK